GDGQGFHGHLGWPEPRHVGGHCEGCSVIALADIEPTAFGRELERGRQPLTPTQLLVHRPGDLLPRWPGKNPARYREAQARDRRYHKSRPAWVERPAPIHDLHGKQQHGPGGPAASRPRPRSVADEPQWGRAKQRSHLSHSWLPASAGSGNRRGSGGRAGTYARRCWTNCTAATVLTATRTACTRIVLTHGSIKGPRLLGGPGRNASICMSRPTCIGAPFGLLRPIHNPYNQFTNSSRTTPVSP